MNEIAGFKRMVMGDYLGSLSYMGSCCGCGAQFMSTSEIVFVPTDDVARANCFRHGPACGACARKTLATSFCIWVQDPVTPRSGYLCPDGSLVASQHSGIVVTDTIEAANAEIEHRGFEVSTSVYPGRRTAYACAFVTARKVVTR